MHSSGPGTLLVLSCLGSRHHLGKCRSGLSSVLAPRADQVAVLPEDEGERHASKRKKGGDGRGPVDTEIGIHVSGEEREGGAEKRAEDRVGGQNRGGEDGVRVDQVAHETEEDHDQAAGKETRSNDGHNPVDLGAVSPCEPEEADGEEDGADDGEGQAGFGRRHAAVLIGDASVALVVEHGVTDREHHADGNTNESQTTDARAPATDLLEDDGEGGEHEVKSAVDDGHVERGEKDDRLGEEQDPRAKEGDLDLFSEALMTSGQVQAGDVDLAGFLAKVLGTTTEDDGSVGLGDSEGAGNPEDTGKDGHNTFNPAPALSFTQESADNGTDGGTQEGSHGKDAGGNTTLC